METTFFVMAPDTNHTSRIVFGGKVMAEMDKVAFCAVLRFLADKGSECKEAVTFKVEELTFNCPAYLGDIVYLSAFVAPHDWKQEYRGQRQGPCLAQGRRRDASVCVREVCFRFTERWQAAPALSTIGFGAHLADTISANTECIAPVAASSSRTRTSRIWFRFTIRPIARASLRLRETF